MKEIWKGFPGLESRYLVSNFGKIYSLRYKKLLSTYSQDGYDYVSFVVNRKHTNISVHRAVALTFIPNPEGKEEVNHIDGNKKNNSTTNLEWVSRKENVNHAIANNLRPRDVSSLWKDGKSPLSRTTLQLDFEGNLVKEWESQISASRALGVSQSGISKCCRGVTASYHGFVWKFKFPPSPNNK